MIPLAIVPYLVGAVAGVAATLMCSKSKEDIVEEYMNSEDFKDELKSAFDEGFKGRDNMGTVSFVWTHMKKTMGNDIYLTYHANHDFDRIGADYTPRIVKLLIDLVSEKYSEPELRHKKFFEILDQQVKTHLTGKDFKNPAHHLFNIIDNLKEEINKNK